MKLNKTQLYSISIFLVPLCFLIIFRFLGFDGLYGMDSFEYFRFTKELKESLLSVQKPGSFFWPQGYPILVVVFSFLFPVSLAGQLVSCLGLSGIAYFTHKSIKIIYKNAKYSEWFVFLSIAISPYFIRNGIQFMSDISSIFFFTACINYSIKYYYHQTLKTLSLCGFFAVYGVFIRYGIAIPLVPVLVFVLFSWFKKKQWKQLVAILPIFFVFILHYWFKVDSTEFMSHHFIDEWSFSNYFKTEFLSDQKHNLASFSYTFPNILYFVFKFFHPGFFILNLALFAIWIFIKKQCEYSINLLLIGILLINYLFLAGVTLQGERYLMPSYSALLILIFPAFVFLVEKIKKLKMLLFIGLTVLNLGLSVRTIYPSYERNSLENEITEELIQFQNRTLYVFEMDLALQQRALIFEYKNLWFTEFESFEEGSLVLFSEEKFRPRFAGKSPMNNWNKLNSDYRLIELMAFDKGWKLYEIE